MQKKHGRAFPVLKTASLLILCAALTAVVFARSSQSGAVSAPAVPGSPGPPETASAPSSPAFTSAPSGTPEPESEVSPPPAPTPAPEPEPEYFTISMVGDCTLAEAKTRRGWTSYFQDVVKTNYAYPFENTKSYFEDDYLTIANLECVLSEKYAGYPSYAPYDSIEQFVFLAPAAYAKILSEGSVEFATLANNHTMDFGQNAYNDTVAALSAEGIACAGENETYLYRTDDGLKIGIYCLYNRLTGNALSIQSEAARTQLVSESRDMIRAAAESLRAEGAEYLIACLHMGQEGSYETSDIQVNICRSSIDSGFDLVYCSHSHRLQPAEEYGGGMIFYGLGNWIFGGNNNPGYGTDPAAYDTVIAQVTVCRKGSEVRLDGVRIIPCSISSSVSPDSASLSANSLNDYRPTPYTQGGAAWERTMSILRGEYAGSNYVPNYGDVLAQMNG